MPTFSPSAAYPSARLHDVVDFPTPPLPEATATTCLIPGMPAGFDVVRAFASVSVTDTRIFRLTCCNAFDGVRDYPIGSSLLASRACK